MEQELHSANALRPRARARPRVWAAARYAARLRLLRLQSCA